MTAAATLVGAAPEASAAVAYRHVIGARVAAADNGHFPFPIDRNLPDSVRVGDRILAAFEHAAPFPDADPRRDRGPYRFGVDEDTEVAVASDTVPVRNDVGVNGFAEMTVVDDGPGGDVVTPTSFDFFGTNVLELRARDPRGRALDSDAIPRRIGLAVFPSILVSAEIFVSAIDSEIAVARAGAIRRAITAGGPGGGPGAAAAAVVTPVPAALPLLAGGLLGLGLLRRHAARRGSGRQPSP